MICVSIPQVVCFGEKDNTFWVMVLIFLLYRYSKLDPVLGSYISGCLYNVIILNGLSYDVKVDVSLYCE